MGTSYFVAGLAANACVKAQGVVVTDEHALADFQYAKLQNGRPWEPFIAATPPATDWEVVFDTNQVLNPSYESNATGEAPTSWVVEAGSPTVETQGAETDGTKSLRLNADGEAAYQDIEVVCGKRGRVEINLFGDGTNDIEFYLIDTKTGKYKTTASETSWTSTPTLLFTRTTASWATSTQTLVVDDGAAGGQWLTDLRLRVVKNGTGTAYVDLVIFYPDVDFVSLHDYNYHDSIAVTLHSSNDNFSADDDTETTLPVRRFRTFSKFTPVSSTPKRWRKLLFTGTCYSPLRIGQPVLGEATTMGTALYGSAGARLMPQTGIDTDSLRLPVNRSIEAPLNFDLNYLQTGAAFTQVVEQLIGQSRQGAEPVVVVLDSTQTDLYPVIHCRAPKEHRWTRPAPSLYEHSIRLVEDPFAL